MDRNQDRSSRRRSDEDGANELEERLVKVNRVAKVIKGGRRFAFGSIVVVGDGNGRVGVGMGKALEVPDSIRKGVDKAKRSMINVPIDGSTIPHEVEATFGGARVLLKPASPGTGVIAGGGVRAVIEVAGVRDILTKSLGSSNQINVVQATLEALKMLEAEEQVVRRRQRNRSTIRRPFAHEAGMEAMRPRRQATPVAPAPERGNRGSGRRGGSGGGRGQRSPQA